MSTEYSEVKKDIVLFHHLYYDVGFGSIEILIDCDFKTSSLD